MIVNHCEKVLLNSFLSFKGQGLKLRVFHGTIILVPQQILHILTLFCNGGVLRDSFHVIKLLLLVVVVLVLVLSYIRGDIGRGLT